MVSPWWALATLALVPAAAWSGVPEPVAAAVLGLLFVAAVARHPGNGVAALVLASAFALGEPKTPYFHAVHGGALLVLLSAAVHAARGRLAFTPRHGAAAAFLVLAAVASVPLDLPDLLQDLWLVRSLDWPRMVVQGVPDRASLQYLDRVGQVALATGLFLVAAQPALRRVLAATLRPLALLVLALSAFGLLRFFGVVRTSGQYLTLSFWTWAHPDRRLTAVAWNPDYLALFLVLAVPILVTLAQSPGRRGRAVRARALAAAAAGLGALALVFTFQRAAWAALLVALAALLALQARAQPGTGRRRGLAVVAGALLVLGVAVAVDHGLLQGRLLARAARFADDPTRLRLWTVALRMAAAEPLLGVGTGRYAAFFADHGGSAYAAFGPFWGTAHSLYLHVLAEQGLIGLASLLVFFGGVWGAVFRGLPALPEAGRLEAVGILASLAGWFAYGAVQYTFRVEALTYLAFVLAGSALALVPLPAAAAARAGVSRRRWLGLAALGLGAMLVTRRLARARGRGVTPGYEAGFHRWERPPDGRPARWTRGRAALTVPVGGRVLVLPLRAPIPGVEARPQGVRVRVTDGGETVVRLATGDWHTVTLPVRAPRGRHVLVELTPDYTFVPARLGSSRDERTLGVMVGEPRWQDE